MKNTTPKILILKVTFYREFNIRRHFRIFQQNILRPFPPASFWLGQFRSSRSKGGCFDNGSFSAAYLRLHTVNVYGTNVQIWLKPCLRPRQSSSFWIRVMFDESNAHYPNTMGKPAIPWDGMFRREVGLSGLIRHHLVIIKERWSSARMRLLYVKWRALPVSLSNPFSLHAHFKVSVINFK